MYKPVLNETVHNFLTVWSWILLKYLYKGILGKSRIERRCFMNVATANTGQNSSGALCRERGKRLPLAELNVGVDVGRNKTDWIGMHMHRTGKYRLSCG